MVSMATVSSCCTYHVYGFDHTVADLRNVHNLSLKHLLLFLLGAKHPKRYINNCGAVLVRYGFQVLHKIPQKIPTNCVEL